MSTRLLSLGVCCAGVLESTPLPRFFVVISVGILDVGTPANATSALPRRRKVAGIVQRKLLGSEREPESLAAYGERW